MKEAFRSTIMGIFLIPVLISNALAQQENIKTLKVLAEPEQSAIHRISDEDANRDINGNLTAGVLIVSDLDDLTFRSDNGIVKTEKVQNNVLLYLSESEQTISIIKEGYPPYRLVFSKYNVKLQPGIVWEVKVGINSENTAQYFPVRFSVEPANSTLYIGNLEYAMEGSSLQLELKEGTHSIQVYKPKYELIEAELSISADTDNRFSYELEEAKPLHLKIKSVPAGAEIFLNNEMGSRGQTPMSIQLYPGPVKIELKMVGYKSITDEFMFKGTTSELTYRLQSNEEEGY